MQADVLQKIMEAVFIGWAILSLGLGLSRPGIIIALSLNGYNYEQFFGGDQAIGNVAAILPACYAVFELLRSRHFRFHLADLCLAGFFLLYLIAVVRSPDIDNALMQLAKVSVFGIGNYFCMRVFLADSDKIGRFCIDLMVANAVLTIFFGIVARPDLPGSPFTQIGAGNQVGFSLSINFALSLLLAYVITPKRWRIVERPVADWLVTIVLLAGVLTVAVLNGKRGGILSPFIAVLFLLPLVTARTLRGLSKHLVLLAFIVIGLSIPVQLMVLADLLQSVGSDLVPERFKVPVYMAADFFGLYEYRGGYDPSNDARIAIFRQAIETIVQHPVFGSGVFSIQQHGLGYAHSIFLELWLEGGLVLLVSFLALFIYVVVLGVRQAVHSRFAQAAILFLGGMGGTFVHMWTALTLYEGKMLWLGLGGIVGIELLRRRHRSIPKRARAIRQSAGAVPTTPAAALNVGTGRATAGE